MPKDEQPQPTKLAGESSQGRVKGTTRSRIGPLSIRLYPELRMIAKQGMNPADAPLLARYLHEFLLAFAVLIGLATVLGELGVPIISTKAPQPPMHRFQLIVFPCISVIFFILAFVRTERNRIYLWTTMHQIGVRVCTGCGCDMSGDDQWRCARCGWVDRLRVVRAIGNESDPLRRSGQTQAQRPARAGIGPITLWSNPELHLIRAQGVDPHRVKWIVRYYVEYVLGFLLFVSLIAVWTTVQSLASAPAPVAGTPTWIRWFRFAPLVVQLPLVCAGVLFAMNARRWARSSMREAGVRVCLQCGYDTSDDDAWRCSECGCIDRMRAPRHPPQG